MKYLSELFPELAKEWHPTKNKTTPSMVKPFSSKKVWWLCNKGKSCVHEWESTIGNRTSGNNKCPFCSNQKTCLDNCLATVNPELAKEWHPTRNAITPYDITSSSGKKVWWLCNKGKSCIHEWESTVANRSVGNGCPYCTGVKVCLDNCLATVNPELAKEWHPTRNTITPYDITSSSGKKVWWLCSKGKLCSHEWEAAIYHRNYGKGCPFCCANPKVCLDNCLATVNPELAKEWHPVKNNNLTPYDITAYSNKKVWWLCSKGHETVNDVSHRNIGNCYLCYISKGEDEIKKFLIENNFSFEREYKINGCKNKQLLRFDFCVKTGDKITLIEYQGIQHEKPIFGFKPFVSTKISDKIKKNFCRKNNIDLIIIWYYDFNNIKAILTELL